MSGPGLETRHASCVAISGHAVLIEGPSGCGKSDLALRLIDRGAVLVSDDYTDLLVEDGRLLASPPLTIAGKIEVRGVGIVAMPFVARVTVALLVAIDAPVDRLPSPRRRRISGIHVASIAVSPYEATAPIKVELILAGRVLD